MAPKSRKGAVNVSCDTHVPVIKLSYTWRLHNFSMRRDEAGQKIESSHFSAAGHPKLTWCLSMYPHGESNEGEDKDFVSLFLRLVASDKKDVHVERAEDQCLRDEPSLCPRRRDFGWKKFIKRARLLKGTEGLLTRDKLTIFCEVLAFLDSVNTSSQNMVVSVDVPECNLSDDFGHLLESRQLSDVVLSVQGKEIRAHKVVLAARCPVFAAMFQHEMKEEKEGRVEITDCDFEVLHQVIKYIYMGRAPKLNQMAEKVLVAADKYDLARLKAMCEDVLCSKLSVEKAAETLVLADTHNADQLKANALQFIRVQADEVKETDGWKRMASENPHLVLEAFYALVDEIGALSTRFGRK
ncbi:hypothetical protein HPB48_015346 [Haemaphysalis longicornis]|uniref:Speckle-type POZ protein n=1 Tax=Haemaphysalis longicornis TaxID=44386 RepID=A0A9J6FME7_HAELO|nr:hypothetical protein HPB48_015346 [Haemaphysalis longicornis]